LLLFFVSAPLPAASTAAMTGLRRCSWVASGSRHGTDVFDDEGEATVHVWRHGDGWRSPNVRDILLGLSEGAEVRVALSE
jgi:hypothetical protein